MTAPSLYFRCDRLLATLSVADCRANRARKAGWRDAARPAGTSLIQPIACRDCPLAPQVDAGKVPLLTAEEVRQGRGLLMARRTA